MPQSERVRTTGPQIFNPYLEAYTSRGNSVQFSLDQLEGETPEDRVLRAQATLFMMLEAIDEAAARLLYVQIMAKDEKTQEPLDDLDINFQSTAPVDGVPSRLSLKKGQENKLLLTIDHPRVRMDLMNRIRSVMHGEVPRAHSLLVSLNYDFYNGPLQEILVDSFGESYVTQILTQKILEQTRRRLLQAASHSLRYRLGISSEIGKKYLSVLAMEGTLQEQVQNLYQVVAAARPAVLPLEKKMTFDYFTPRTILDEEEHDSP